MKKKLISISLMIIFAAFFGLSIRAGANGVGTTSANFLKIDVGARAAAMGGAFTALADDGSSLYWNPAGITQIKTQQFFATYNIWFQSISQGYLSYIVPFGENVAGFALNYVDMGKMQGYDENGLPTHQFGASDVLFQIAYAKKIAAGFSLGISGGYLTDSIDNDQQTAFQANIGLMKSLSKVNLGFTVQNVGSGLKNDPLPLIYKVGLATKISNITLACDAAFPADNQTYFCAGLEFPLSQTFTLRAGYRSNQDIGSGISAGIGFNLNKITLDYAYVPYAELGDTHRISLGMML